MHISWENRQFISSRRKADFLKKFPMQIDLTGMEINVVILVNLSTTEVTGPSIVHLLPKHSLQNQPRWCKRLMHRNGESRSYSYSWTSPEDICCVQSHTDLVGPMT